MAEALRVDHALTQLLNAIAELHASIRRKLMQAGLGLRFLPIRDPRRVELTQALFFVGGALSTKGILACSSAGVCSAPASIRSRGATSALSESRLPPRVASRSRTPFPARPGARRSFVSAGAWEMPDGPPNFRDFIVRRGDTSSDGIREKARFVLSELEQRMAALGFTWADTTATQVYTVHDLHPFLADEIVGRGAARAGLTWHFARPPVMEFDYEIDTRGVTREIVI